MEFQNTYLNNIRGLIRLFDCLLYREDFILLPGDEIVEKKHANIKTLTAQLQKQETGKKNTRKWPGLGPSPFEVDLATLFDVKEFKGKHELLNISSDESGPPVAGGASNEISGDVDI